MCSPPPPPPPPPMGPRNRPADAPPLPSCSARTLALDCTAPLPLAVLHCLLHGVHHRPPASPSDRTLPANHLAALRVFPSQPTLRLTTGRRTGISEPSTAPDNLLVTVPQPKCSSRCIPALSFSHLVPRAGLILVIGPLPLHSSLILASPCNAPVTRLLRSVVPEPLHTRLATPACGTLHPH